MLIPVVLCGGVGARLWPVSRESCPKPFIALNDGESLLCKTYRRAVETTGSRELITVTNRDYFFMCRDELGKVATNAVHGSFLLEPFGRNTAPAVLLASFFAVQRFGQDVCLLVLAADHMIDNEAIFAQAVKNAELLAMNDYLVTFGIKPSSPETGFGYIEVGDKLSCGYRVKRFVEKPDAQTAQFYLADGHYLWNSGMFCFKAENVLKQMAVTSPDLFTKAASCWEKITATAGGDMMEIPADEFGQLDNISLDYALMERASNLAVVPSDFTWNDIGSWGAYSELLEEDEHHNRTSGEAIFIESTNTFVQSDNRMVAAVGLDNVLIVDTSDALLVVNSEKTQDVKKVVEKLKKIEHETYKTHKTVSRPWGTYTVLEEGSSFKVKRIVVKPGGSLSLQMHRHRDEHWIIVSGMAHVVNGGAEIVLQANKSTYIPAGNKHRLSNHGQSDIVMIEVQSGDYLGEDDIVRFEDIYGRV